MEREIGLFYEVMWRIWGHGSRQPLPWWVQQQIRHTPPELDLGVFASREHAFVSNAFYRYWYMIGVKDHKQECLIGQAGEIEPVYDAYCLSFFLFDPASRSFSFPQFPDAAAANFARTSSTVRLPASADHDLPGPRLHGRAKDPCDYNGHQPESGCTRPLSGAACVGIDPCGSVSPLHQPGRPGFSGWINSACSRGTVGYHTSATCRTNTGSMFGEGKVVRFRSAALGHVRQRHH